MIVTLASNDRKNTSESEKYFDETTFKFLMWILLSIIVSFAISMSSEIPNGAGLGGLFWIFGPLISGAISFWIFFFLLLVSVRLKTYVGWAAVIFNLGTGISLFFST